MKITVCDDQEQDLMQMLQLSRKYVEEKGIEAEITSTMDPEEPMRNPPDILVLDIEMPGRSGIDVKNSFSMDGGPFIIFATSHDELFREAFGVKVIGFLSKPLAWESFRKMMDVAVNNLNIGKVIDFGEGRLINSRNIVMITTDEKYTKAVIDGEEDIRWIRRSLRSWEEELTEVGFVRIHKPYLVNCRYIKLFEGQTVVLKDGQRLEVSRERREECFKQFREYNLKHAKFA